MLGLWKGRLSEEGLFYLVLGSLDLDGKRGEFVVVEYFVGCKRVFWKFKRKLGVEEEDGWQVLKRSNIRKFMFASLELKV